MEQTSTCNEILQTLNNPNKSDNDNNYGNFRMRPAETKENLRNRTSEDEKDTSTHRSTQMIYLLNEFTKIYNDKLKRIEESSTSNTQDYFKNKIQLLGSWVEDLSEQNATLVGTVEELEREATQRVSLLQEKLDKMAVATRDSCLGLKQQETQMTSLVRARVTSEAEVLSLTEKLSVAERALSKVQLEKEKIQSDFDTLSDVMSRSSQWGSTCTTPEVSRKSYSNMASRLESQSSHDLRTESQEFLGFQSLSSNPQDFDTAFHHQYSSIHKGHILTKELQSLRASKERSNKILLQRDRHIVDLQKQLTYLHHQLSEAHAEAGSTAATLLSLQVRNFEDDLERASKEESLHLFLSSPSLRSRGSLSGSRTSLVDDCNKTSYLELQLSDNIDVLAARIADLEKECCCEKEKHLELKNLHQHCSSTINQLQNQVTSFQQSKNESRNILLRQLSERREEYRMLEENLLQERERHHETRLQLDLKAQILRRLQLEAAVEGESTLAFNEIDQESRATQTDCKEVQPAVVPANPSMESPVEIEHLKEQLSKLENEVSEKGILLIDLQNHLASSRLEVQLKDETICKIEHKLEMLRRDFAEKEERTIFLSSQLTSLQLELSQNHGQNQYMRRQIECKNRLITKVEVENTSLISQLNEKSNMMEKLQLEKDSLQRDYQKKEKEITEQRLAIGSLRDALESLKMTYDKQCQEVSGSSSLSNKRSSPAILSSSHSHPSNVSSLPVLSDSNLLTSMHPSDTFASNLTYPFDCSDSLAYGYISLAQENVSSYPLNEEDIRTNSLIGIQLQENNRLFESRSLSPICPPDVVSSLYKGTTEQTSSLSHLESYEAPLTASRNKQNVPSPTRRDNSVRSSYIGKVYDV